MLGIRDQDLENLFRIQGSIRLRIQIHNTGLYREKELKNDLYHLCGVQQPDWAAEPNTGRPGQEHQDREGGRTAGQSNYLQLHYIM
jgi:hypothetical protein